MLLLLLLQVVIRTQLTADLTLNLPSLPIPMDVASLSEGSILHVNIIIIIINIIKGWNV